MATAEFIHWSSTRREGRYQVAAAWAAGQPLAVGNVSTDGRRVRSYAHVVGITEDGRKVAFDCHYSVTTAKQCSAFKAVADEVRPCEHFRGGFWKGPNDD